MKKGILFDLDGTLLDTLSIWDGVAQQFLKEQHLDIPEHLEDTIKDLSFAQSAQYFITYGNLTMSVQEVTSAFDRIVMERYAKAACKANALMFVQACHKAGIAMGVVTATSYALSEKALRYTGLWPYMQFVLTCESIGKGKDEADIYIQGAQLLHQNIEDILVFEDALYCIKTAAQAGFDVIGMEDTHHNITREDKQKYTKRWIHDFKELME